MIAYNDWLLIVSRVGGVEGGREGGREGGYDDGNNGPDMSLY